jgi:RNA polymerase sigma factor (sigma-70 family)
VSKTYPKVKRIKWPKDLISKYFPYVVKQAIKFSQYHDKAEVDDLIQEGCVALLKSHASFDDTLGFKFLTHAYWWIRAYMWNYLHSQLQLIYVPTFKRNTRNKITGLWDKHPTDSIDSFEKTVSYSADGEDMTLESIISDNNLEAKTLQERQDVWSLLSFLEDKHAYMLQQYFGYDKISPHTFEEIGKAQGVTRQCAEQRLKIAIKKLKHISKIEEMKSR